VGDQPAHDAVADEHDERRAGDRRRIEFGRDEMEAAQVAEQWSESHHRGFDPRSGRSLYSHICRLWRDESIIKRLYGSEAFTWLAEELLSNRHFTEALTRAVQKGLETKGRIDRNIEMVLRLLNLPSRADLTRLATKLEVLQGSLVNLNLKVDRLMDRQRARRRKRGPKPPPSTADTA
jgi:hypothetical protein